MPKQKKLSKVKTPLLLGSLILASNLAFAQDAPETPPKNLTDQSVIQWQQHNHIRVALVGQAHLSNEGEESFTAGVLFQPEDGWHIYWRNAGDTGLPTKIAWAQAGDNIDKQAEATLAWPFPEAIPFNQLVNYGYHGETLISTEFPEKPQRLSADVSWLICKEACIPGKTTLAYNETSSTSEHQQRFNKHRDKLPKPLGLIGHQISTENNQLTTAIYADNLAFSSATKIEVFPVQQDIVHYSSPAKTFWKKNLLRWEQPLSEYYNGLPKTLDLVIVVDNQRAYHVSINTEANAT